MGGGGNGWGNLVSDGGEYHYVTPANLVQVQTDLLPAPAITKSERHEKYAYVYLSPSHTPMHPTYTILSCFGVLVGLI